MRFKTAIAVMLVLLGGVARAAPDGGLILEVKSAIITLPSNEVVHVDGGVYLDEPEAVRLARELATSRQQPVVQPQPSSTVAAVLITAGVCLVGGFILGVVVAR